MPEIFWLVIHDLYVRMNTNYWKGFSPEISKHFPRFAFV